MFKLVQITLHTAIVPSVVNSNSYLILPYLFDTTHLYFEVPPSGDFTFNVKRSSDISPELSVTLSSPLYHKTVGFGLPPALQTSIAGFSFLCVTFGFISLGCVKNGTENKIKNAQSKEKDLMKACFAPIISTPEVVLHISKKTCNYNLCQKQWDIYQLLTWNEGYSKRNISFHGVVFWGIPRVKGR